MKKRFKEFEKLFGVQLEKHKASELTDDDCEKIEKELKDHLFFCTDTTRPDMNGVGIETPNESRVTLPEKERRQSIYNKLSFLTYEDPEEIPSET